MNRKEFGLTAIIVALAMSWKLWLVALDVFPFNADEAVVALMARHIQAGARPMFFYGQAYMGSLDAYLVRAVFEILGQTVLAIRITQSCLYLGTIITTIAIARLAFNSWKSSWLAGLLLAIPTVNATLYTTVSLGGYGEALLIGNLILLVGIYLYKSLTNNKPVSWLYFLLLGGLVGLGLWANGLTLIYSLPVGAALIFRIVLSRMFSLRQLGFISACVLTGFFVGSLPWWVYASQNGMQALVTELLGTAVAVETQPWLSVLSQHLINLSLLGFPAVFGLRPPWEVRWLAMPLIPVALIFWISAICFLVRKAMRSEQQSTYILLLGICICLVVGFLLTPFGIDPSGRYFLPLNIIFALAAGQMLVEKVKPKWHLLILSVMLLFQGWGTLDCATQKIPGITTQFDANTVIDTRYQAELIQFLREQGETRGYSNYWVAYPLAFLSQEEIIFAPRLPYHADLRYTTRDDRYPVYTKMVEESAKPAYITLKNPNVDNLIRQQFSEHGITWHEKLIGDYQVFYGLSRRISPVELDFSINALNQY